MVNVVIKNSIQHLPRGGGDKGFPPTNNPFFIDTLAAAWEAWYEAQGYKHKPPAIPEAGPYRGSMASTRCDRALAYKLADVEESNPPTLADFFTFWLGQLVHEAMQPIIMETFPGAAEARHDLRPLGIPGSSHSDLALTVEIDGHRTLVEIKTINGFGFKTRVTTFKGPPQGPTYGSVMQALLSAKAEGIERVIIILVSLEKLSPSMSTSFAGSEAGRFMAEWHYTVSEMEAQIEAEVARINDIIAVLEQTETPVAVPRRLRDPEYPSGAVVSRPLQSRAPWQLIENGHVVDAGEYWGCGYCSHLATCRADG